MSKIPPSGVGRLGLNCIWLKNIMIHERNDSWIEESTIKRLSQQKTPLRRKINEIQGIGSPIKRP